MFDPSAMGRGHYEVVGTLQQDGTLQAAQVIDLGDAFGARPPPWIQSLHVTRPLSRAAESPRPVVGRRRRRPPCATHNVRPRPMTDMNNYGELADFSHRFPDLF
jgi:hypothetical protein